jgi:HK97 family phage portal protein
MHLLSRIFGGAPEAKDSRAGALFALHSLAYARWTTRSAVTLTQAGYERNAVVFRAVRMIAEAAGSIPWLVFEGRQESPEHPLADLVAQPNAGCSGIDFFEALFSNLLLFGNAYIEAVTIDGSPREFHSLRPDRMSVVPGRNGWPAAYDYSVGGQKVRYDMQVDGVAPILHLKCFHPLDDYYGFAPIAAVGSGRPIRARKRRRRPLPT